jgi:hypothetical protein
MKHCVRFIQGLTSSTGLLYGERHRVSGEYGGGEKVVWKGRFS